MKITKTELLHKLQSGVSETEWKEFLENPEFPISKYNRITLMEMKDAKVGQEKEVSVNEILKLRRLLKDFLSEYMKEKPEWWKWIIIVCVYQTYVAEKPMHPIEVMKIRVRNEAGKTIYECPGKTEDKNTVCYYCVCQAMPDGE